MKKNKLICSIITCIVGTSIYLFLSPMCYKKTDTFTIRAITSHRPFDPAWETRALSEREQEEVNAALSQKFHYFGRGGQCYAFFSEDGKYVLKFLRQRRYTMPLWYSLIPPLFKRYKEKKRLKRQHKLQRDFFSYQLAFEELHDLTGVMYVHLNPTQHLKRALMITDPLHSEHRLELDHFDFILQKRAQMIYPTLTEMISTAQTDQAKQIIDQVINLIVSRCQKGYEDWDPHIRTNCGLIDDQVIKIDVGKFIYNEEMKTPTMCCAELERILTPFQEWLSNQDPDLAVYCKKALATTCDTLSERK